MGEPRRVVGAALLQDGRLLACRRVLPAYLAGGWEFPGGKVEPGEDDSTALIRECREELGVTIGVGPPLPGEAELSSGFVVRVHEARIEAGEPAPLLDHDATRWLGPEELDEVEWLPADLGWIRHLRDRLLDGVTLPGGNVGGAVRIGPTVRRPTGPWTPAVHALLRHLERTGLDGVPTVRGVDARGREVLDFLPGATYVDGQAPPDTVLEQVMRWLRRYHAAVRSFRPSKPLRWRFVERGLADDEIVCHHDVAPYNTVVDGDRLVGIIDWDVAGPGRPVEDLGFAAWNFVPLWRETGPDEAARRLRLMSAAYGGEPAPAEYAPTRVLAAVGPRIQRAITAISQGQAAGDPGMRSLGEVGEPARTARALAAFAARLPTIRAALR